jgi:hypothetical protein
MHCLGSMRSVGAEFAKSQNNTVTCFRSSRRFEKSVSFRRGVGVGQWFSFVVCGGRRAGSRGKGAGWQAIGAGHQSTQGRILSSRASFWRNEFVLHVARSSSEKANVASGHGTICAAHAGAVR